MKSTFARRPMNGFLLIALLVASPAGAAEPRWTSFVDTSRVAGLAVDGNHVWAVGGGVQRYDLETGRYTVLRSEHGLASNDTRAIALDGDRVWVATTGGLSRYSKSDGSWKSYFSEDGLGDEFLVSMALDAPRRVLWLGGWEKGVSAYDLHRDRWRSYGTADGLTAGCVLAVAVDPASGAVFFGTWGGGVSRFDPSSGLLGAWDAAPHLAGAAVSAVAVDDDAIWIGTVASGLHRYDRQRREWRRLPHAADVSSVLTDSLGGLWVGSRAAGLKRYIGAAGSWTETTTGKRPRGGVAPARVAALALGDDGSLVLGTWGDGIVTYTPESGRIRALPRSLEISHNFIVGAAVDERSGRLLFASEGGGGSLYDPANERWQHLGAVMTRDSDQVVNDFVVTGNGVEDRLWVATIDGVAALANSPTRLRRPRRRDLKNALVESLSFDRAAGVLWAATNNQGLYRLDLNGGSWRPADGIPAHIFFDIAWDAEAKVVWCGTRLGVLGYDAARRAVITGPSFPAAEIRSILVDDRRGTVWAGSWDSGLFRYDKRDRRWTRFTPADGLPGEAVVGLAIDDQAGREALWVGTNNGAGRYDLVTGAWQGFRARDGLAHDFILAVVVDRGAVWFGTWGGGVSRYEID